MLLCKRSLRLSATLGYEVAVCCELLTTKPVFWKLICRAIGRTQRVAGYGIVVTTRNILDGGSDNINYNVILGIRENCGL
jgi:hypothetical protein